MANLEQLDAGHLRAAIVAYRDALGAHREAINRLNVYPVPDGDTGTNMALTLESVVTALEGSEGMAATCQAIAHGSLMGARGNSGVILSQVLRGITERCRETDAVGPEVLADALGRASTAAYAAVMKPVEGTILTVAREAAAGAAEAAGLGKSLVDVLDAAKVHASEAVARTPEQLPVLKQAGVVDAGGVGFVLLLDALLLVAADRPLPPPPELAPSPASASVPLVTSHDGGGVEDLRYEVMYLLDAPDEAVPVLKEAWAALGGSIVVVGGDGLWNCHVHTDDIGGAVEAALDAGGRPRQIRVTDLHEQVEAEHCRREPDASPAHTAVTAVVAVVSGEGLGRIFRSLGADRIVAGGQSMNPSTAELLEAVEAAGADQVVLLPNNANIVPVARQVDALTAKTVRVVPTTGMAQGLGALLPFDPKLTSTVNAEAMTESAQRVVSGEVTRAVRASVTDAGPVAEGDWLGLSDGRVVVVAPSLDEAAARLLDRLVTNDHELVTVVVGEGSDEATTARLTGWLARHRPHVTAEVHAGDQPVYPYLIAVE